VFREVGYLGERDVSVRTPDVSADRKCKVSSFTLWLIFKEYQ